MIARTVDEVLANNLVGTSADEYWKLKNEDEHTLPVDSLKRGEAGLWNLMVAS
jgi:hypothetical protein